MLDGCHVKPQYTAMAHYILLSWQLNVKQWYFVSDDDNTLQNCRKSYIYANYNPKYAQQVLTIFRTFYNFCWRRKSGNAYMTPAQKLGLTDKVFDYKDIFILGKCVVILLKDYLMFRICYIRRRRILKNG